jgi:transposase
MVEHYIGVDLHKAFFQVCVVNAIGERLWEQQFPRSDEGIAAFVGRCPARTALAVEASTPTWHFADAMRDHVEDLRIVDSLKTRLKAGYAAKTDRLDARRLADALRRDSVVGIYHPPMAIRELRELCRGRHTLVQLRTRLLQRLRAILLRQGSSKRDGSYGRMRCSTRWCSRPAPPPVSPCSGAYWPTCGGKCTTSIGRCTGWQTRTRSRGDCSRFRASVPSSRC